MKKTIFVSIIVSAMLFASTDVTNLTVDNISKVDGSSNVSGATVNQGQTNVDANGITGSDVDDVTITQKDGTDAGNLITGSTIGDGTNTVTVNQGTTTIENSKVSNVGLSSVNKIESSTVTGDSKIEQGTLLVSDSNLTDSNANDVEINSQNTIANVNTDTSDIYQSSTKILGHSDVDNLNLTQTNNISVLTGTSDDINASLISQAETSISSSDVTTMIQHVTDDIIDVNINSSVLTQAKTDIGNSSVTNLNLTQDNDVANTDMSGAVLAQGYTNIQ